MSDTQANTIRDLLIAAIAKYDPSIDLTVGGRAYASIINPVYNALTPDLLDGDTNEYLLAVLKEEYPTLELQDGDLILDLLVKPLRLILEPLKAEINLLRKRQSLAHVDELTIQDAEDLAANFFVTRKKGSRARGTVRIMMSTPSFISITDRIRFSTADGLFFYPLKQEFISVETASMQRIGSLFYVDIGVIAEAEGDEYNIAPGLISVVEGIPNFVSCTNPYSFEMGTTSESKQDLIQRVEQSLTERSLTSRKGIKARLNDEFDSIVAMSITGYGDPEMQRDVLVGSGDGSLIASGMSFILGRYVFMITGYEDSNGGRRLPSPGDKVKLNFWKFMYTTSSVEDNEIEKVIYSSYGDAADLPTVHIFQLKHNIHREPISGGALPGIFLGVFTAIQAMPTITISGVPSGIVNPENTVASGEVHLGGKYDVWVRPSVIDQSSTFLSILKSGNILEDVTISFDGSNISPAVDGIVPLNRAGLPYALRVTGSGIAIREPIVGTDSGAVGFVTSINGQIMSVSCRVGLFIVGETITGSVTGNQAVILGIDTEIAKQSYIGCTLTASTGGSYFIIGVEENYYILSKDVEEEQQGISAYIHRVTGIENIFAPVFTIFPENAAYSSDLQTFVGRYDVEIYFDIAAEGVRAGDVLEILQGTDSGKYSIANIAFSSPTKTVLVLDARLSRTNSNVKYRVIREGAPVDAPLIRVLPDGIKQIGSTGGGYSIPYKKPVGSFALGAFSGSIARHNGLNGVVLPNMSEVFAGPGAYVADLALQADPAILQSFSSVVDDCISEGCTPCNGIPVTCTVTIDGPASVYQNVKFYITGLLNANATSYLSLLKAWVLQVIEAFFKGVNTQNTTVYDDLVAFIDQFSPIIFGEPPTNEVIVKQFELCMPHELFDGCNNTMLAIPEFLWDSEFASVTTFSEAITEFLAGRLRAKPTALKYAKPGDSLQIHEGANKGEYVIDKVVNVPWYHGDTIATETTIDENNNSTVTNRVVDNKAYDFTIVVIKGSFPNETLKGSGVYFQNGLPTINSLLPTVPTSTLANIHTINISTGTYENPFDVIQDAYTVLFQAMYAQGFDLPETFALDPGPVLTKIVKSFFAQYTVGTRSPQQTTRMLFQDPIDTTVFSATKCGSISWRSTIDTPPSIRNTGFATVLPMPQLSAKVISVFASINGSQDYQFLTGTLPDSAGTTTNIQELINIIQHTLDPNIKTIRVSYVPDLLSFQPAFRLVVTMLRGGENAFLKLDHLSAFRYLGFTSEVITEGSSSVGSSITRKLPSNNGTRFSITQETYSRSLIVDIQDNEEFYSAILPRRSANLELSAADLPRDSILSSHATLAESCTMYFSNADGESPIEAGVRPGDLVYLHEQVCTLDNTGVTANPFSTKKDRVLHVRWNSNHKSISLLSTAGTFLTPESTNQVGESPEQDVVEVGDLVVFEELEDTATVVRVTETELFLDKSIPVTSQPTVLMHGKAGSVNLTDFSAATEYTFTSNDVGYYLVIYGSENAEVDGTYTIDAVSSAGVATLSETFAISESNLHWAIVKAGFEKILDSAVGGFSSTVGLSPVRIYRGVPKVFPVGAVSAFLQRDKASIEILYNGIDGGPRRGVNQPFKILRPNEYRMTAQQMELQGKVSGLYYMDVPTTTLTPSFDLNIPENTQYTPIVNTLHTRGYDLVSKDKTTVFSTREECSLVVDSSYFPKELSGAVSNAQSVEGSTVSVAYESSITISTIQALLDDKENRTLTADPLVRHFLPGYIYLEITGGQSNEEAQELIIDYINKLDAEDSFRLSDVERQLHLANVDRYDHPIFIHCVTHDLNRNIVLTRVDNYLDDSSILHDGTNRITYFIASKDTVVVGGTL